MKLALLALSLLLVCSPAFAQVTPTPSAAPVESGTIETLDAKNGFRKYVFGTPISDLSGFEKRKGYYVNNLEPKLIGDVSLNDLKFMAYDGKLSGVSFTTIGTKNCQKLLEILQAQYGDPQINTLEIKKWVGNKVTMHFVQKTSYGAYNVRFDMAIVYIGSKEAEEREEAASQEAAKKMGAKDL